MDTILERFEKCAESGPKYKGVAQAIVDAVRAGEVQVGEKLPPVRELAWKLNITPGTVARAYTILTDDGVAIAEVGRGTYIADINAKRSATKGRDAKRDLNWERHNAPVDADAVSLFSAKLPDCGQVALIRDSFARLGDRPAEDLMNYPSRAAFKPAREAVVHWLKHVPLGPINSEDMVLCHGGQNGISLALQAILTGQKPVVLLEELTYPGFRRAAELLRAEVVSVPMDDKGIIPEALERLARQHGAQVLCTTPEMHNPTGLWTPMERRMEIAAVAERVGFQIIDDDCYRMAISHEPSYRALVPELAWYVSSISKILTPALRVGFVVAPRGKVADLRRAAEHGFFGLARPLADVTEMVLSDPELPALTQKIRDEFARYVQAGVNVLGGHDLVWRNEMPFMWLTLPAGWRAAAFCQAAEAEGVQIRSADEFALRDARVPHAVRISINAQVTLSSFEKAMGRLRVLLDNPPERIAV